MKRLEFHITYICNHACIFCSEDDRMKSFRDAPLSLLQVKVILIDRAKKGYNHVNFTGGEPLLFPQIGDLLCFAKRLGYRIYVGTNGTLLAQRKFAEEVLASIDELSLSVHWFDDISCREQTGDREHFSRFPQIIENIKQFQKKEHEYFANLVVNRGNYRNVLKIITFLIATGYPLHQILISVVAPEGLADHHYADLVFDLREFCELIPDIVRITVNAGIRLRFFGLPTCILGESYQQYANDAHWEERHTIERFYTKEGKVRLIDIYSPDNSRKRVFVEKCDSCKWKESPCTGVFGSYLDYYPFS